MLSKELYSDEEIKEAVCNNLRYYMDLNSLSQRDLCRAIHVSPTTMSDWYNGKKTPRMGAIAKMADFFECKVSDLIVPKGKKNNLDNTVAQSPYSQSSAEPITPLMEQTMQTMRSLNDVGQQKVSDYASDLKSSGQYKYIAHYSIDDPEELEVCDREWIALPLVGSAAAGSGNWRDASEAYWVDFPSDKIPPHATAAFKVDGNSMTGLFEDGDYVFVDHNFNQINGKPYVLDIDGMIIVKKLYWEQGRLRIVSNNPDWEDRFLPYELGENAYIYGIVVGHYTPTKATEPRSRFDAL